MGRNKEPINLILAKGNKAHKTKEEIQARLKTEIKGNTDNIVSPSYLKKKQKERFDYLAKQLIDINILTNLDVESLARYIVLEEQYNKIIKAMNKVNIIKDAEEYDKMLIRQTKIFNMLTKSASDLGLTISSRCKLVIPKKEEKPKNKFEKFGVKND